MSGSSRHPGGTPGAGWQALSGDVPAQPPAHPAAPPAASPTHPGWQQPWQDELGQWHYPYASTDEPPPAAPAIVPREQLAPVGPPRYAAPARPAQDPRRRTMAAVITFVSLLVALWAILGFTGSLSRTLASISSGSEKLEGQLADANEGLAELDRKTGHLRQMSEDSKQLKGLLGALDSDMGGMLAGVDRISAGMEAMDASVGTLEGELRRVNEINAGMADTLTGIDTGLASQVKHVRAMRRDVVLTGGVLGTLPGRLRATNGRLTFINDAVNTMGCRGITNNLEVDIRVGPIPNGSAKVYATVVPPGAWGTKPDGVTPC